MNNRRPTMLGVLVCTVVAAACGSGRTGSVKNLGAYDVGAGATDESYLQFVNRSLTVSFAAKSAPPDAASCASLGNATVTFNGRQLGSENIIEGGWGPTDDFYKSGDDCQMPFIWVPLPRDGLTVQDAVFEISGEGVRFRVAVPGLIRQQEIDLVSVGPGEAVVQPRPALLGRPSAFLKDDRGSSPLLPSRLVAGAVRIDLTSAARGDQTLEVWTGDTAAVSACEGFSSCAAGVDSRRDIAVHIPSP